MQLRFPRLHQVWFDLFVFRHMWICEYCLGKISSSAASTQAMYKFDSPIKGNQNPDEGMMVKVFRIIAGVSVNMKALSWKDIILKKYM